MTEMKFATVNGITLHYQIDGASGGVPLLFLNSLGCNLRIWDGVVSHLLDDFSIVRFDTRGHGLSDTPPAPYSLPDLAGDVIGLLDHLHIEGVILVGLSVGGMVALQTALDFPERVKALVLCDTAARIATPESWNDRINTMRQHGMPYLADAIVSRWFTPEFIEQNPAIYRGFYNLLTRMPLDGYVGTCAALRDADLSDRVKEISVPALVLCGEGDVAVPPDSARKLADSLANARFQLIANAAHIPSVEQPGALAAAMMEFLNSAVSPNDKYAAGMRVRRAVLGNEHVDRAEANKTAFDADFQRFITETAWGSVWSRPGLNQVTRHLLTMAILAALGREHELALHVRATRNTGVTPEQLREAFLHVAVYAGIPAANTAFSIAKKVYAEFDQHAPEDEHP